MAAKRYSIAVYLVDKQYGGPEEGGWWFEAGYPSEEHAEQTEVRHNRRQAVRARNALQDRLDASENVGRRPISSVLSTGEYRAVITLGPPRFFPEVRPHYE